MAQEGRFLELVHRVRARDEDAAAELVREYEPAIRRAVRMRLVDARLRRVFDSLDICQSVLSSFFLRAALGEYELKSPDQLIKLLVTMARNKLASHVRLEHAQRRDLRQVEPEAIQERELVGPAATPSRYASARELLQEVHKRFSRDERALADARVAGRPWDDIATEWGESAEALRKRHARTIQRVAAELGLDL